MLQWQVRSPDHLKLPLFTRNVENKALSARYRAMNQCRFDIYNSGVPRNVTWHGSRVSSLKPNNMNETRALLLVESGGREDARPAASGNKASCMILVAAEVIRLSRVQ